MRGDLQAQPAFRAAVAVATEVAREGSDIFIKPCASNTIPFRTARAAPSEGWCCGRASWLMESWTDWLVSTTLMRAAHASE